MRWPTSKRPLCISMPEEQQRWYAIKIFERDEKVMAQLKLSADVHGAH